MNKLGFTIALAALNVVLLPLTIAGSASGHGTTEFYGAPHKYAINQDVYYNIDLSVNPDSNWEAVANAESKWSDRATGRSPNFIYAGEADLTGAFTPCSGPNAVFKAGMEVGTVGYTPGCYQDGKQVGFTLVMNNIYNYYWGTGTPASNQIDARSILTHEFGHATGWYGHFAQTSDTCGGTGPDQTMCRVYEPSTPTEWRSLEEHDKHTIDAAYN